MKLLQALVLSFLVLFASGCFLDSGSKKTTQPPPEPSIIAPTASFSVSQSSGKAALTVDFSDSSTQGSAAITRWQWDFGDGGSSDQQNPQHIYQTAGVYDVSLTVTSSAGSDTKVENQAVTVEAADIVSKFSVVDARGLAIEGVTIESDSFQIEATSFERQKYRILTRPTEQSGVIKIIKPGYLKHIVYFDDLQTDQDKLIMLKEKSKPIVFDADLGGSYSAEDGASVSVPGQAFVTPDGADAFGEVELYITPIDISDQLEVNGFPGSFFGAQEVGAENEDLFSYGVVDITFEQQGQELQLKEGVTADVTLPLYATKSFENEDLQPGDTIPIWYLDEESGIWIFESNGSVVEDLTTPNGLALQGTTTHFTSFNADINPPGLNGQGGSGGGGGTPLYVCNVEIDLIGAIEGSYYDYDVIYFAPGWPSSVRSRTLVYDGEPIQQGVLAGFVVKATIRKGEIEGSTTFSCGNPNELIRREISLGDAEPQFVDWSFRSVPVFTKSADDLYEIKSNKVYLGGYFTGTNEVVISSDVLTSPLILDRYVLHEWEYQDSHPETVQFVSRLSNEYGENQIETSVNFVENSSPIVGYAYAYVHKIAGLTHTTIESVDLQGADSIKVYDLGNDPTTPGSLVFESLLPENSFTLDLPGEYQGFFRLEFTNQYGMTSEIIEVGEESCPPFTDLCSTSQSL